MQARQACRIKIRHEVSELEEPRLSVSNAKADMSEVVVISSDGDSDSDLESIASLSAAHEVVFTPTKRPPSPGTSDEEDPDR